MDESTSDRKDHPRTVAKNREKLRENGTIPHLSPILGYHPAYQISELISLFFYISTLRGEGLGEKLVLTWEVLLYLCSYVCNISLYIFFDCLKLILSFKCDINPFWYFDVSLYFMCNFKCFYIVNIPCNSAVLLQIGFNKIESWILNFG